MTATIAFDPSATRHPLRRALPASIQRYRVADAERWRRDARDFLVTFALAFFGILTLFG